MGTVRFEGPPTLGNPTGVLPPRKVHFSSGTISTNKKEEVKQLDGITFEGLEAVNADDIPSRTTGGRGNGKYFAILTNFVDSGQEAALVHFGGDVRPATVSAYMRKLIAREGWNVNVVNRQGNLYLVRS